jgi:hypothetical protein
MFNERVMCFGDRRHHPSTVHPDATVSGRHLPAHAELLASGQACHGVPFLFLRSEVTRRRAET